MQVKPSTGFGNDIFELTDVNTASRTAGIRVKNANLLLADSAYNYEVCLYRLVKHI
ncbi:hypothetical protein DPMN_025797 [Dreissena polymorpha]|uniref:Uncharacterized protein n=1 Tax=Dreissena polymorpha TaxID=45954 RepID=A0A9D4LPX2_DREPO|nr:hypothetical protein DPMN_025797 [Dreissena polymorpha]